MTYEKYKSDCKSLGFTPTMSKEQFDEMNRVKTVASHRYDDLVAESNKRRVKARLANYERMEDTCQKE